MAETQVDKCTVCGKELDFIGAIAEDGSKFCDTCYCPNNSTMKHVPDWHTVYVCADGDQEYLDVSCKFCGATACIGNVPEIAKNLSWEGTK